MPRNVTSLLNHITLSITSSNLSSYLSYFFSFLSKNNTSSISFFSFNNYFNLCSFLSSKLYAIFNKEKDDLLSKEKFIDGMVSLYLSNIDSKATMIFNLCDFDNDGVIKRDDVKMIITHFHFMTKNTDVSIPIKFVDTFFSNSDTLTLKQFYNTVKSKSSDLIFLILFYLYHYKPFTQNEVDFFISHMSHRKLSSISLSSYDTFQDIADISELLIEYINTNFNYEFEYESVDEDDYSDLNDLLALEEDFNQIKEDSLSMSTMASPVKKTSLSHIISNDELTKGSYGTVSCAPPEMFRKDSYNKSIDVWSMGVVIYYIYYGAMPFSNSGGCYCEYSQFET